MGSSSIVENDVNESTKRYQTLISLMLSSQTKDEVTSAAMKKLQTFGLTVENILKLEKEELEKLIYPVGFYKRKSEYILKTTKILKEKFNSDTPMEMNEILKLPGVGPKMAPLCLI
jgi:endonuclease III